MDADRAEPAVAPRLHVVLVEPEIAANAGSVGRTCVALGARLWLVRPLGFHLDDRRLRRAGLDYWETLDVQVVDDLEDVVRAVGADHIWLFSTRGTLRHDQARFRAGDALLFGPESRGLPQRWLARFLDRVVRLPMRAEARSLNVAVAAAVGAYEAMRQIGFAQQ